MLAARRSRESGSRTSNAAATVKTRSARPSSRVKMLTQSRDRHAGTTPAVLRSPRVGLRPMVSVKPAGMRPEPAVSVPSAKSTSPAQTATAEPELEPPGIIAASKGFRGVPYGERVPTRPVAN